MLCAFSLLFCVSTIYLKICMKVVAMSRSVNSSSLTFWFFFFHQPSLKLKQQIMTLNGVSEVLLRRGWNGSGLALRLSGPQLTSGTMDEWVCRSPRYVWSSDTHCYWEAYSLSRAFIFWSCGSVLAWKLRNHVRDEIHGPLKQNKNCCWWSFAGFRIRCYCFKKIIDQCLW